MNRNIRILFIINNLLQGGAEGVFKTDAKTLSGLGYHTEIYQLYPHNFKNLYDVKSYINLILKIKREKVDVVYSTLDDANFVAKIVRIFCRFKLFCREANMTEDKSIKFKITDIVLNFFVNKLIMVAEAVKNSYASYDPYHKNKMTVLYNGVNIPSDLPEKTLHNPIRILAVGSFTKKKGFQDLVQIFRDYIIFKNKEFKLEIVGDGIMLNQIRSQIEKSNLGDYIMCPGSMERNDLQERYEQANIFVLTSRREGCPNVLLEACAYGVAPVCFDVGGVKEIIENNISGIVVPRGDKKAFGRAIDELLENKNRIREMGLRARQRMVDKFSYDIHIKNLLKILEL